MRPKEVIVGALENLNANPKIVVREGVWGNKKILIKTSTDSDFISKVLINEKEQHKVDVSHLSNSFTQLATS